MFLDPSLPQSPGFFETIALVYNVKSEATPHTSVGVTSSVSASPSLPSSSRTYHPTALRTVDPAERINDLYAEWDTMDTVNAVRAALAVRFDVAMIEADERAYGKLNRIRPFFVFNMAEGLHGPSRESQIPAMLEMLRIPYLGSDPLTLGICLDKSRAKEVLSYHGIRTAPFRLVESADALGRLKMNFPAIVKPLHEGSSKGIYDSSVVRSTAELEREVRAVLSTYHEPALVEDFLPGREFTVAIMGNGDDVRVLPIVEIRFDTLPEGANPIYSYEAKWVWDTVDDPLEIYACPAPLEEPLRREIETLCVRAYRVLRCRDWSRIDVRLDGRGRPHILEVNPMPGILPRPEDNSCFPKAARVAGMSYSGLINAVTDIALARCGLEVALQRRAIPA